LSNFKFLCNNRKHRFYRDLFRELVLRNIKVRYRGTLLGIAWSFFYSLAQLVVFYMIFASSLGERIRDYPSYIFIGLISWTWFTSSLFQAVDTFATNRELTRQPGFPTVILPFIIVFTTMIDFLLGLPLALIFVRIGGSEFRLVILALPLIFAIQFLLLLLLSALLAAIQVNLRDMKHLLNIMLRLGFFLTPIFYEPSIIPQKFLPFYFLNPMFHVIKGYRMILLDGQLPELLPLISILVIVLLFLPFTLKFLENAKYQFMETL